jgi:hypothetical protein
MCAISLLRRQPTAWQTCHKQQPILRGNSATIYLAPHSPTLPHVAPPSPTKQVNTGRIFSLVYMQL